MKTIAVVLFAFLLSGCAGFPAFVAKHAATIGAVGTVATAVSATTGAALNTLHLVEEVIPNEKEEKGGLVDGRLKQ